MSDHDKVFAGSIPKCYDTLMVPLIFESYAEEYAEDTAKLIAASSPAAVLETAAGSGAVTRALAPRLPAHTRYVVTDLNAPMLDYAASRQPADERIEWRQADALAIFPSMRRPSTSSSANSAPCSSPTERKASHRRVVC